MSSTKPGLTKVLIESPELVEGCLNFISSVIPEDAKASITEKLAKSYTTLQSKWKDFFGDYEEQLKSFLPFVGYVHDMTTGNELFWREESGEFYYGSVEIDEEERHEYKLSIDENDCACLDVVIFINQIQDNSFCIGQEGPSIHPLLEKKLRDLFLLVEDMVSKERCSESNKEEGVENQATIEGKRIASFVLQLIVLTEKKSIVWTVKESIGRRFRVLIKKRDGIKILVELMRCGDGSIEVRAAQVIDNKPKKIFHISTNEDADYNGMQENVKCLYALVESRF